MMGRIHSFETLGALDGPGVRFIVFMQGCPMECIYCHNPDTWHIELGLEIDSNEVVQKALRYRSYFGVNGGVTLSGGEPLYQGEFAKEILKGLKKEGIHTAVDTSGYCFNDGVREALKFVDLVILDIKHSNPDKFNKITGRDIDNTLRFLEYVGGKDIPLWVRQVILPGFNDTKENIKELEEMLKPYKSLEKLELLPYHTMGTEKGK